MKRAAFTMLELVVVLGLASVVLGGAYFSLSTGQGATQRGMVLLEELSR